MVTKGSKRLQHHIWTDAEDEIVRTQYRHNHASAVAIANQLGGLTPRSITARATHLRITKDTRVFWPEKDEMYLRANVGRYSLKALAKHLHKTPLSVKSKLRRMGLLNSNRFDRMTLAEVGSILGMHRDGVRNLIQTGKLKAMHNDAVGTVGARWDIYEKDLRTFIRTYPSILIGRNLDIVYIVDLLAGVTSNEAYKGYEDESKTS